MRRLDRRRTIDFVDVADAYTACPLDRRLLLERLHAREDGAIVTGAAPLPPQLGAGPRRSPQRVAGATPFAAMWRVIPLLRPLGLAARSPTVLRLLERLYLIFLRFRPPSPVLSASRREA